MPCSICGRRVPIVQRIEEWGWAWCADCDERLERARAMVIHLDERRQAQAGPDGGRRSDRKPGRGAPPSPPTERLHRARGKSKIEKGTLRGGKKILKK